jgi:hypothetical protein
MSATERNEHVHHEAAAHPANVSPRGHAPHLSPFWRHFVQMLGVMGAGMLAAGFIIVRVGGSPSWDAATIAYPTQCLLGMAAGMTVPMVAWMLYRGMGWRNSAEMAAVMVVPVIPFLCLVLFDITKSAQCGAYCAISAVAMLALMRYRREDYATHSMHAR